MVIKKLRAMFQSNRRLAERLAQFRAWLIKLPVDDARVLALRALVVPGHFVLSHREDTTSPILSGVPADIREFLDQYSYVEAGGAIIDSSITGPAPDFPDSLVIGSDIEHADLILRSDGTVFVADTDTREGLATPFSYPSLWHYLLEVEAFTWPDQSEAARIAAA